MMHSKHAVDVASKDYSARKGNTQEEVGRRFWIFVHHRKLEDVTAYVRVLFRLHFQYQKLNR